MIAAAAAAGTKLHETWTAWGPDDPAATNLMRTETDPDLGRPDQFRRSCGDQRVRRWRGSYWYGAGIVTAGSDC